MIIPFRSKHAVQKHDFVKNLNHRAHAFLADLFLHDVGIKRSIKNYRVVKNAFLLVFYGQIDPPTVFDWLAEQENTTPHVIERAVCRALTNGKRIAAQFNKNFEPAMFSTGKPDYVKMPVFSDPLDTLLYLGTAFFFLIETNYSEL